VLALGALALAFVPQDASAATPRIVGTPKVRNTPFHGVPNTLMYDVRVTVDSLGTDAGHTAMVGYVSEDDYTTCASPVTPWKWTQSQAFDTTKSRTFTLYNFVPGTAYYYKVMVGDPTTGITRTKCGELSTAIAPTPTLPEDLGYLNIQYRKAGPKNPYETKYVMLETDDCGSTGSGPLGDAKYYLVVLDPTAESIVWYLDISAATGTPESEGSGFHYIPGPTPDLDRVLMTVNHRTLYEFSMDGKITNMLDLGGGGECDGVTGSYGPCPHHDAFTSQVTGDTYVLATRVSELDQTGTVWEDSCDDSLFIDDGWQVLDPNWDLVDEKYMMSDYDYDPTVDGGPTAEMLAGRPTGCFSDNWARHFDPAHGLIDWTHSNSISTSDFGGSEVIDFSLKEWSQVVRIDATTGDILWIFSSDTDYSDWGTLRKAAGVDGAAMIVGQHDVHATAEDRIMMLDNRGEMSGTRVVEVSFRTKPTPQATLEKAWQLVNGIGDELTCGVEGTGRYVPGTTSDHVVAMCNDRYTVVELNDATGGVGTPPPLSIELPDVAGDPFCTSGGPDARNDIHGWHKAYPMANIGQF
jgi:hypothetical protein